MKRPSRKVKGQGAGPKRKKPKSKAKANPIKLVTNRVGQDGKMRVHGKKQALKGSQVYPARFALAVVRHHWGHRLGR